MPSPPTKMLSFKMSLLFLIAKGERALTAVLDQREVAGIQQATSGLTAYHVGSYGALGDSYASGPGAGKELPNDGACKRFDGAFGPQINADTEVEGSVGRAFNFVACLGDVTGNIYRGDAAQAGKLAGTNPELVTLSISGNDVGFVDILDRCVYRYHYPFCTGGGCGSGIFPTGDCTEDCNAAIEDAQAKIDGDALTTGLDSSISAIFENAPTAHLYLSLYPQFFNAETTQCNDVQFKVGCSGSISQRGLYSILPLTQERRRALNTLTANLNQKIIAAVNRTAPPPGAFINVYDPNPLYNGHRFCEEGTIEPSLRNPNIWFFPFEYKSSALDTYLSTFNNATDCTGILGADGSGDWSEYYACQFARGILANGRPAAANDTALLPENGADIDLPLLVFIARTFHPTQLGHTAYRDAFVSLYATQGGSPG